MTGPSHWWPTPADPASWFSADELARSQAYHQPLLVAAVVKTVARVGLLLACVVVGADGVDLAGGMVTVGLVAVAWWLPETMVDVWYEFVHEPSFGASPLPARRFAVGSTATLVITGAVVSALAGVLWLADRLAADLWWLAAGFTVVPVAVSGATLEPRFTAAAHRTAPLDRDDEEPFQFLAAAAGVQSVEFERMDSDAITGLNALTASGGRRRRVVLSRELLEADRRLTDHVVAHELTHLRLRHSARTLGVTAVVAAVAVAVAGLITSTLDTGPPGWRVAMLPMFVLALLSCLGLASLPLAFLARAQERQADTGAFELAGPVPLPVLRRLHVTERALLAPGVAHRLVLPHPPAAERLQRAQSVPGRGLPSGR